MFIPSDGAVLFLFLPAAYVDVFLLLGQVCQYMKGFPL